jgi:BolA protein
MKVQSDIENKLTGGFTPSFLAVTNESYMHSVPANSETHFKVVIVSDTFTGKRSVRRHQMVYDILKQELSQGVHALALHTFTPEEWQLASVVPDSPNCLSVVHKSN